MALTIGRGCPCTVKELRSYAWDPRAAEAGEDRPKKENDHAMDCLKYWAATPKQVSGSLYGFYEGRF